MKTSLITTLAFAGLLIGSSIHAAPITDTVTVGGIEWAQPVDFIGAQNWNYFNSVCPLGVCSGTFTANTGTWDMDGWRWASVDEVNGLFNVYLQNEGVAPGDLLVGPDHYQQSNVHTWAPAFMADFLFTTSIVGVVGVTGLTSSIATPSAAYAAGIDDITPGLFPGGQDAFSDFTFERSMNTEDHVARPGGWFYRAAATAVPLPSTLWILGLSLVGLRGTRRRAM